MSPEVAAPMPAAMAAALAEQNGVCERCGMTKSVVVKVDKTEKVCACCDLGQCGHRK